MLFNSVEFLFIFLPLTLLSYFLLIRYVSLEWGLGALVVASFVFYGYWNPSYLVLIIGSIIVNFYLGQYLSQPRRGRKAGLIIGITVNLAFLGYYKYLGFFTVNLNALLGTDWNVVNVVLPLAISFFTFQQLSFLVDAYQGKTKDYNFLHYCLFVTFFPQLIAGPIVHHKEMLPQFDQRKNLHQLSYNMMVGLSIFAVGLFKKTVLADQLSHYVSPVFDRPDEMASLDFVRAWSSTLAYTFQLYFDFSGYSDMAIGIARMFGIILPINFFSPYKSLNIIDFWRRWHITLSRFLRDYLYFALGGNQKGKIRRYVNLFLTMLLGGLWHGASWNFVIWGGLHGSYLMMNHGWRAVMKPFNLGHSFVYKACAGLLTFLAVVLAWVYFRAPTLESANHIVAAMLGMQGIGLPSGILNRLGSLSATLSQWGVTALPGGGLQLVTNVLWLVAAAIIAFIMPNTAQLFQRFEPVLYEEGARFASLRPILSLQWRASAAWALGCAVLLTLSLLTLGQVSEFLYFQF